MRRILLLLIVSAVAMAQCSEVLSAIETTYAPYLAATQAYCDRPEAMIKSFYSNVSQLAEHYSTIAQCYKESGDAIRARAYYSLSAEKYSVAADALCSTDIPLEMRLLTAAGDTYKLAGQTDDAMTKYSEAITLYEHNSLVIDAGQFAIVKQRVMLLENPIAQDVSEVGENERVDWVPLAIAGLFFVGIGLVILSLKK